VKKIEFKYQLMCLQMCTNLTKGADKLFEINTQTHRLLKKIGDGNFPITLNNFYVDSKLALF